MKEFLSFLLAPCLIWGIKPFQVQPLPPQNLSVSLMTSGDFLLTWKGYEGNPGLSNALEYEVAYKQKWESWENAALLSLSNTTRCHLSHEGLVPGSSYAARVRARPGPSSGFSGQFSEWSTEASWETREVVYQGESIWSVARYFVSAGPTWYTPWDWKPGVCKKNR